MTIVAILCACALTSPPIVTLLQTMGRGYAARVVPDDEELTNGEAAEEDEMRRVALDELTGLSDELGLYD